MTSIIITIILIIIIIVIIIIIIIIRICIAQNYRSFNAIHINI